MDILDLPDECILQALAFLPVATVLGCAQACKRLRTLVHSDVQWLPRLLSDFGLSLKSPLPNSVTAVSIYKLAKGTSAQDAIRFLGCFTDGGCDENQQQYWVDNMFAPNKFEAYCSGASTNVNCIGVLLDDGEREKYDEFQRAYREYLIRRLRLPAGVVYGHGIVNMGVLQGDGEAGADIVERLAGMSSAELEHLFLEFHDELTLGNAIGRLLLHGLAGQEREDERAFMVGVAQRIRKRRAARMEGTLPQTRPSPGRQGTPLPPPGEGGPAPPQMLYDPQLRLAPRQNFGSTVGILDRLVVSRAGNFSCPVQTGVVFLANISPNGVESQEDMLLALQDAASSPTCRAFDGLRDARALGDAVKKGVVPPRLSCMISSSGVFYEFCQSSTAPPMAPPSPGTTARPRPVGPLRPVMWFRFHNRAEKRRWAGLPRFKPKMVWQGADPDLHPQHQQPSSSSAANGAKRSQSEGAPATSSTSGAGAATSASRTISQLVGGVHQLAQAWLGGGTGMRVSEEEDDELTLLLGSSSDGDDESLNGEDSEDDEDGDGNASPRGTKGRDTLEVALLGRWAGNLALVKLTDQENLMPEFNDRHQEPNIDINHVLFAGRSLRLPPGAVLGTD